jgi:hypothetical protein
LREGFDAASLTVSILDFIAKFQCVLFNALEDEFDFILCVGAGMGEWLEMALS